MDAHPAQSCADKLKSASVLNAFVGAAQFSTDSPGTEVRSESSLRGTILALPPPLSLLRSDYFTWNSFGLGSEVGVTACPCPTKLIRSEISDTQRLTERSKKDL